MTFFRLAYLSALLCIFSNARSQKNISVEELNKEFYHSSENDVFLVFDITDKDYTFGEIIGFRFKGDKKKVFLFSKETQLYIHEFEAGLMAFTPDYDAHDFDLENNQDRPFAGWIYGQYSQYYVFEKSYFSSAIQLGSLGPNAKAGKLQNWYHTDFDLGEFIEGWDTQVPNTLGLNFIQHYARELRQTEYFINYFKTEASLGNIFTYLDTRAGISIGNKANIFTFSRLANPIEVKRIFFDLNFGARFTLYDATLQGNLFKNNRFVESERINSLNMVGTFGMRYLNKRWLFNFLVSYQSNTIKNFESHRYGSIIIAYSIY